jgi:hypothetical protein
MRHEGLIKSGARNAGTGLAFPYASCRKARFAAIMCRKFAGVTTFSWHLASQHLSQRARVQGAAMPEPFHGRETIQEVQVAKGEFLPDEDVRCLPKGARNPE